MRRLDALLRVRTLSLVDAIRVTQLIAEVLAETHARGLHHGSLRSDLVEVTEGEGDHDWEVHLLHFEPDAERRNERFPEAPHGKGGIYRSPEEKAGRSLDARTDVWGLGVLLTELLTDGVPFSDADAFFTEMAPLAGTLPEDLERLVERALDPDPEARFRDAAEMATALRALAEGMRPRRVPSPDRAPAPARRASSTLEEWGDEIRAFRRRLASSESRGGRMEIVTLWLVPALVVLVILGLFLLWWWSRG